MLPIGSAISPIGMVFSLPTNKKTCAMLAGGWARPNNGPPLRLPNNHRPLPSCSASGPLLSISVSCRDSQSALPSTSSFPRQLRREGMGGRCPGFSRSHRAAPTRPRTPAPSCERSSIRRPPGARAAAPGSRRVSPGAFARSAPVAHMASLTHLARPRFWGAPVRCDAHGAPGAVASGRGRGGDSASWRPDPHCRSACRGPALL